MQTKSIVLPVRTYTLNVLQQLRVRTNQISRTTSMIVILQFCHLHYTGLHLRATYVLQFDYDEIMNIHSCFSQLCLDKLIELMARTGVLTNGTLKKIRGQIKFIVTSWYPVHPADFILHDYSERSRVCSYFSFLYLLTSYVRSCVHFEIYLLCVLFLCVYDFFPLPNYFLGVQSNQFHPTK